MGNMQRFYIKMITNSLIELIIIIYDNFTITPISSRFKSKKHIFSSLLFKRLANYTDQKKKNISHKYHINLPFIQMTIICNHLRSIHI